MDEGKQLFYEQVNQVYADCMALSSEHQCIAGDLMSSLNEQKKDLLNQLYDITDQIDQLNYSEVFRQKCDSQIDDVLMKKELSKLELDQLQQTRVLLKQYVDSIHNQS